ncbi:hypothetical protein ASPNIDRAFT_37488 [Aspergillus niger ATCC 1015]|uniref:Uncharacterized protein n=1 Tax=Aspergillus niger (strain ATCC 1015 / CBS 113.46 / FGSC A1144 / LSHB Ac4 / NCTC 3858a / NRRL 328 / USDA 3528.7) TaxID=380704 RepID=G3Y2C9_ASPNA|nr:hypothetical protein ASPNIDRAFT_37488 [Aspergillus niger ATCC 1015]
MISTTIQSLCETLSYYLIPSPEWSPFWDSLYDGLGTCMIVWIQLYFFGMSNNITIQLTGFIAMHLVTFPIVAWHAYYGDGWTEEAVDRCLGIVPVLVLDVVTVWFLYWRRGEKTDYNGPFKG